MHGNNNRGGVAEAWRRIIKPEVGSGAFGRRARLACVLASVVGSFSTASHAATLPEGLSARVEVGLGRDTNAFREHAASNDGWFIPYHVAIAHEVRPNAVTRLRTSARGSGQAYLGSADKAGETEFDLGVGYAWRLIGDQLRYVRSPSLDLKLQAGFSGTRKTFIARSSGEEFIVRCAGVDVRLDDRFNSNSWEGSAGFELRFPRSTQWAAEYEHGSRNFLNDYDSAPCVDRLDYNTDLVRLRLIQRVAGPLRARLEYARSWRGYVDRPALDLDGNVPPVGFGETRRFRYHAIDGETMVDLGGRGEVSLGAGWKRRDDPFQGYYDFTQWSFHTKVRVNATRLGEIRVGYDYAFREYERAHVDFNPVRPLREDHERAFTLEGRYLASPNRTVFARLIFDNVDERNQTFTYERLRTWAGFEIRL